MATSSDPQNHSHHLILLTSIAVMISVFSILGISYLRFLNSVKNNSPQNYQDCVKLKDSIITLSYPQTCTTKDGKSFVQSTLVNSPTSIPSRPTTINENKIFCQDPRPEICTEECLLPPPYLCGSNGKSYCTSCQTCADSEVDWYRMQDNPCSSLTEYPE